MRSLGAISGQNPRRTSKPIRWRGHSHLPACCCHGLEGSIEGPPRRSLDKRNPYERSCCVSLRCRNPDAHGVLPEAGNDLRVADWSLVVFAQIAPHPADAIDARDGRDVGAHDDDGGGRPAPHHAAHLSHLSNIHNDRGDPHDVVLLRGKSSTVQGPKIFSWIIMMPQDRWNMRRENTPCSRITWL